jgi:4-alpha-glucanotransferase
MKFERSSGILLHPTSLPSPCGIGDLGPAAYRWIDWLAGAGCKLWQVLPLGHTGYGDSPYQCFSAFAGNPYLISPEQLLQEGLLEDTDLRAAASFPSQRVDYGALIPWKLTLLEKAFQRLLHQPSTRQAEFERFRQEQAAWLEDYALFMALKEAYGGQPWTAWPEALRQRQPQALTQARRDLSHAVTRFAFYQYLFFQQWTALKTYANARGVRIIGDVPIFVAHDSADVWANPHLFHLDRHGQPTVVAGVPPDYFSPSGQRWGNPLYRWEVHRAEGYGWWLARLRIALQMADFLRIDHFRGFAACWEVPATESTAVNGRWVPGPGTDFFRAVQNAFHSEDDLPILVEDLGEITPDVIALREQFHLPGTKVLQFAFTAPDNPFLPHNYTPRCVVYTGTHDNDTALGWYASVSDRERDFACRYLGRQFSDAPAAPNSGEEDFAWAMIRAAWASVAVFALAPMQDVLSLGTTARMNYPGRMGGNWEWRMDSEVLQAGFLQEKLRELNWLYYR